MCDLDVIPSSEVSDCISDTPNKNETKIDKKDKRRKREGDKEGGVREILFPHAALLGAGFVGALPSNQSRPLILWSVGKIGRKNE